MRRPGTLRMQAKVTKLDSGWHGVLLQVVFNVPKYLGQ